MTATTALTRSRHAGWMRGALLATALGGVAALFPAQRAEASDVMVRVNLGVADVIYRSGRPYYYEHGYYRPVYVEYDHWHRPHYYHYAPRPVVVHHHYAPPPRHYHAPRPHYRVSYDERGGHGRHGHHGKKGHGHGKHHGGRGWDD